MNPVRLTGRATLALVRAIGGVAIFASRGLAAPGFRPRLLGEQLVRIGWLSLPVVGLTALFTGAALALQINAGGERFQAGDVVRHPVVARIVMAYEAFDEQQRRLDAERKPGPLSQESKV